MVTAPKIPPPTVLEAFDALETPVRIPGGRGLTWRSGRVVLRPTADRVEAAWKSEVLDRIGSSPRFTVPRPIRDHRGEWVHDGWQASEWIPGAANETRVGDVIRAGEEFHRAIAGLPCPAFIAVSDDPWSNADRIAWGEADRPAGELLARLVGEYRSLSASSQVIHGDLLGNVLFSGARPPGIIDWAPYWRPAGLGSAIVAVDAACWHGYPLQVLAGQQGIPHWRQLLLRALVFRIATLVLLGSWDDSQIHRHAPVAAAVIALAD